MTWGPSTFFNIQTRRFDINTDMHPADPVLPVVQYHVSFSDVSSSPAFAISLIQSQKLSYTVQEILFRQPIIRMLRKHAVRQAKLVLMV